jgi:cbb3-type cytochrome oxidase subunit 1
MSAVPADLDTGAGPPAAVPLRHFLAGFGFLLAGLVLGVLVAADAPAGFVPLAHVHLLLVGWVCLTVVGAMTQFVPVWSGVALYSRRLADLQLLPLAAGLTGFVGALLAGATAWLPAFGLVMLVGFWTFVYNLGRTLLRARPLDVTERHFAFALVSLAVLTLLGVTLAADYAGGPWAGLSLPVEHANVAAAHATLGVFGVVLAAVVGALYQLVTMFTATDLDAFDRRVRDVEAWSYPAGVVALAAGRLVGLAPLARVGGLLVAGSLVAFAAVLARRLAATRVDPTPTLRRYAVVAVALAGWSVAAGAAWLADPLAPATTLGPPWTVHLLALGVVGFVLVGTLYHVVPFLIWVERYSDRVGLETVPTVEDLYSGRAAALDFAAMLAGSAAVVLAEALSLTTPVTVAGGGLVTLGLLVSCLNLLLVVHRHAGPVRDLLVPAVT